MAIEEEKEGSGDADEGRWPWEDEAIAQADALYRTALRMTRNPADAEDLVQDVFTRAFQFAHTFQTGTNLRAWLFKILTNTYINQYRKRSRRVETVPLEPDDEGEFFLMNRIAEAQRGAASPSAEEEVLGRFVDEEVKRALEELPPPFRLAVLLADVEGFSYKEIAEILEVPLGTVMSRLHRGRRLLERKLWQFAQRAGIVA